MTDDTQDACAQPPAEMLCRFVKDLKTADRVVIQRRNAIHNFDASYYPNPELIADLIEEQATEIERLGRELNRARYGDPDFAWEAHQAAMDAAQAEIEHLHLLLAERAVADMERDQ